MTILARSAAAIVLFAGINLAATADTPATIPASLEGTYHVTFNRKVNFGVLEDGFPLTMVIAPGGTLCVAQYIVGNPVIRDGSPFEAVWTVPSLGLDLFLSDLEKGFNEVNVRQIDNGPLLAQLNGQKVSNNTTCDMLGNSTPNMNQVVSIIEEAQRLFPDYFPLSGRANPAFEIINGAFSRQYRQTGMEILIKDHQIFLTGKEYGFSPVKIGSLTEVSRILAAERVIREGSTTPTNPVNPGDGIPSGDFSLKISGTVSASVFGNTTTTPLNISIDSIPAPGKTDLDGLADEVRKALANADGIDAATFTSFSISEVSVANNRVFFRAQFAATTSAGGFTVQQSYNLTYEYLRK